MKKIILCSLVLLSSVQPVCAMKETATSAMAKLILFITTARALFPDGTMPRETSCEKGRECFSCPGLKGVGDKLVKIWRDSSSIGYCRGVCCDKHGCVECQLDPFFFLLNPSTPITEACIRDDVTGREVWYRDSGLGYRQKKKFDGFLSYFRPWKNLGPDYFSNERSVLECALINFGKKPGGTFYYDGKESRVCCKNPKLSNVTTHSPKDMKRWNNVLKKRDNFKERNFNRTRGGRRQ